MRTVNEIVSHRKNGNYWLLCVVLSIVSVLALIFSSTQGTKWLVAIVFALIGGFSCLIIKQKLWPLSLIVLTFLIPLRIDFYLLYKQTYLVPTSYPGFPITAFDIALGVLTLYWFFQILRGKGKFYFYPSISIPALVFLLLSGISVFCSDDRLLSVALFLLMVKSYLVFLFFANRIKSKADLSLVVFALMLGVMLQSFVGVIQQISPGSLQGVFGAPTTALKTQIQGEHVFSRIGGTIGHPNALAKYLCFCIPVFFAYAFSRLDSRLSKLVWVPMIAGSGTLMMTFSRGSWVAFGLATLFIFYELSKHHFKSRLKSIALVIVVAGLLGGATVILFEDVRVRLFEDDYGSAEARIPMAAVALNIIQAHPIGGIGLNNYTAVMNSYDRTRNWQTYKFPHPVHNSYLLIAAESGIPALLAFLWLIGVAMANGWPALKLASTSSVAILQIGWTGALMTWLVSAMFDRDFAGTNVMLWFTLAMIMTTGRMLSVEHERNMKD